MYRRFFVSAPSFSPFSRPPFVSANEKPRVYSRRPPYCTPNSAPFEIESSCNPVALTQQRLIRPAPVPKPAHTARTYCTSDRPERISHQLLSTPRPQPLNIFELASNILTNSRSQTAQLQAYQYNFGPDHVSSSFENIPKAI